MTAAAQLALIRSLIGHSADRSADVVLAEVRLAAHGASITDIQATRVHCNTCAGGCDDCSKGA